MAVLFWNPTLSTVFNTLSVALTVSFLVLCCVPRFHKHARSILQPFVVYHVESGLYWVTLLQQYRTDILTLVADSLCHTGAFKFA